MLVFLCVSTGYPIAKTVVRQPAFESAVTRGLGADADSHNDRRYEHSLGARSLCLFSRSGCSCVCGEAGIPRVGRGTGPQWFGGVSTGGTSVECRLSAVRRRMGDTAAGRVYCVRAERSSVPLETVQSSADCQRSAGRTVDGRSVPAGLVSWEGIREARSDLRRCTGVSGVGASGGEGRGRCGNERWGPRTM